jgi:hypothetical protein
VDQPGRVQFYAHRPEVPMALRGGILSALSRPGKAMRLAYTVSLAALLPVLVQGSWGEQTMITAIAVLGPTLWTPQT